MSGEPLASQLRTHMTATQGQKIADETEIHVRCQSTLCDTRSPASGYDRTPAEPGSGDGCGSLFHLGKPCAASEASPHKIRIAARRIRVPGLFGGSATRGSSFLFCFQRASLPFTSRMSKVPLRLAQGQSVRRAKKKLRPIPGQGKYNIKCDPRFV